MVMKIKLLGAFVFVSSVFCLPAFASESGASHQFLFDLRQGMTHPDVLLLQSYLNQAGFTVSSSGPGSADNEVEYFGSRTRNALIKFQDAHRKEILDPLGLSAGSGNFFASTRDYVNAHPISKAESNGTAVLVATSSEIKATTTEPRFPPAINLIATTTPYYVLHHHRHGGLSNSVDPTIIFNGGTAFNDGGAFPYLIFTASASSNSPGQITYYLASGDPALFSVDSNTGQVYALQVGSSGVISIGVIQQASGIYKSGSASATYIVFNPA